MEQEIHQHETESSSGPSGATAQQRGQRRPWLGIGVAALGMGAALFACSSSTGINNGSNTVPAYLIVQNYGSLPAILTIDLRPPVQQHVAIQTCYSLNLQVPVNDSVKVVITDSTATTSQTYYVPFYLVSVWGLDCAQGNRGPVALGNPPTVPTTCTNQGSG
jgi:hypothetical protein